MKFNTLSKLLLEETLGSIIQVGSTLAPHKKQFGACKMWTRDAMEELAEKYPKFDNVVPMGVTSGLNSPGGIANHYWIAGQKDGKTVWTPF